MSRPRSITVRSDGLIDSIQADLLNLHLYKSSAELCTAAATAVAFEIRSLISERNRAIGIFAADPSQHEFFDELVKSTDLEWTHVIAFHLDEYLALDEDSPQSCRRFLLDRLVKRVPLAEFHAIRGEAANPEAVCANYAALLKSRPPDFAVLAIGANGSIGPLAAAACDFNDAEAVKVVELEGARRAISLTIPTIMGCRSLFAIVPEARTRDAITGIIEGDISPAQPASILRIHPEAHLFVRIGGHEDEQR
jgi:glucosamine-6-phosphate deaminase